MAMEKARHDFAPGGSLRPGTFDLPSRVFQMWSIFGKDLTPFNPQSKKEPLHCLP
jgi:hypothetical protein